MPGYDASFLDVPVPLPRASGAEPVALTELPYTHFTVLLHPDRRLAAATAVNVDGGALLDLERAGLRWRLDGRVPAAAQAGEEVYAANDLDRGHLVRRRDAVWGDRVTAARANADTFHYTNAAPQVAAFNQSKDLWLGLEDHVLAYAGATGRRITVLTGPVLDDDDPPYRDLLLPRRFWKVVAWADEDGLAAVAFLLDQSRLLEAFLARERARAAGEALPSADLGAFRTFQVTVAEVADVARLDLDPLPAADRLRDRVGTQAAQVELRRPGDVVLRRHGRGGPGGA